jgi:pimeloyl-ACP methyl ester carboxylesterase
VVAHARKLMLDSSIDGMVSALTALATRTDTTQALQTIAVPTCVIAGEHDGITPPHVMRAMSDQIRGAAFHQIKDVGHLSNLEAPEAFNRLLVDHVKRVAQRAG